jgi:hypothetical protein
MSKVKPPSTFLERVQLLAQCKKSKKLKDLHMELSKRDPVHWINHFCWTFDPRQKNPKIPFILYPYQEWFVREAVRCIREGKDFGVEKSRDMGVSWLIVIIFQYLWLFDKGANFLVGSKKEQFVDTAQTDPAETIFGKFRFNLENLPRWMKGEYNDKKLSIRHENGNVFGGEASGQDFGRSARKKAVLFDELAFWEHAELAWASCSQTTPCRVALSTPFGETNKYAKLMNAQNAKRVFYPGYDEACSIEGVAPVKHNTLKNVDGPVFPVYSLHWPSHPHKDKEWYEAEKLRMTPDEVARELDINYSLSASGRVFSSFTASRHTTQEDLYNPKWPVWRIWDFGKRNATLYLQFDPTGKCVVLYERVLGCEDDGQLSDTFEQIDQATSDSDEWFPKASFIDVADPQGSYKDHRGGVDIEDVETQMGTSVNYEPIVELATSLRKKKGRKLIDNALQNDRLVLNADHCPILKKAMESAYVFKRDTSGNVLDKIKEAHPFEDVVDTLIYAFLIHDSGDYVEAGAHSKFTPTVHETWTSNYLGF